MQILVIAISFILLGGLLLSPIFLLRFLNRTNIRYKFITYLAIGVFLTAFIVFVFAWWGDASDDLLLTYYGYNFDGWSEEERCEKVAPENLEKVGSLVTSKMGIGWPLKAIMSYIFYSPYLLIVYVATYLIGRIKKGK